MQKDDNAYYIDRDWEGNHSSAGSIFEDFRGKINETENTLLYGHNMGNGSMFHSVKSFKEEEWGRQHIYFEVATLEKRYLYRIVASSVLNGEDGAAFDYWNRITLNQEEFQKYIEEIRSTALVWYAPDDDPPTYGDKMIALQTCNSGAETAFAAFCSDSVWVSIKRITSTNINKKGILWKQDAFAFSNSLEPIQMILCHQIG